MQIEIRPEPTDEERAAIAGALAEEDEGPLPAPWQDEDADFAP